MVAVVEGSEAAPEERDWSDLTTVCLVEAFSRLDQEDLWRGAMSCCRSWRDAARSRPALFAALDLDPAFESIGADAAEWWTPAFQRRVDAMLRSTATLAAGELREVRIRHCSDDALAFAANRSPQLSILSIRSSRSVTDRSMLTIASCCPVLTELDISYCYEVSYKSLEAIGQNCPNLIVLKRSIFNWLDSSEHTGIVPADYLRECPQDSDREAITISKYMQKLKHLVLRFAKLSAVGLNSIAEGCKELEILDLFGCANLTSRGIEQAAGNLKNLETLVKPNLYIPRSSFHMERYGHWQLYDERFQTNVFQI
ncbi:hypothetical protein QYE76_032262 [Lolium multiflorum]|uniref:F-box domain-containing protein n=1 Tax=Lolium multiflorum TaxID=4521 RepID=A0AAD8QV47_LOLMU|nr:F-box protein SKIP1-like [Lolium rigidum]XP_051187206.1 F-box protein SKIP1-like [Lolium perenne]KAK1608589.1 hypothetical protein QYE76_032262 [Lolium multiflorum]